MHIALEVLRHDLLLGSHKVRCSGGLGAAAVRSGVWWGIGRDGVATVSSRVRWGFGEVVERWGLGAAAERWGIGGGGGAPEDWGWWLGGGGLGEAAGRWGIGGDG
ncbi:hypothetical protein GUJ93_ZPchr0012g21907 [Zizania palustris]|uniref:Uncharacterized protein n=1 Tax=Zizania palustris TaxID=103762 RepID=A0A8J5WTU3_ZIZPA|nr:hypothetical protein GUJ93_ZPchr0012g21907 [Zizania palustris]